MVQLEARRALNPKVEVRLLLPGPHSIAIKRYFESHEGEVRTMANKTLFKSLVGKMIPATNAINEERAPAYALSPKHQLAQYAATGCLNTTFYATADEQLAKVIELCAEIDAEFIAKTAVFCRERGFMKDMPALLCAVLSMKDRELLARIFPRVIDNAKMLRNFVQIMRSGGGGPQVAGLGAKTSGARLARRSRSGDAVQVERGPGSIAGGHHQDGPPKAKGSCA